jgi:hypothetical protein
METTRRVGQGFSFDTPSDWTDRTIYSYEVPAHEDEVDPEGAPNIVVTREALCTGETLRIHADRQTLRLGQLNEFDLLESGEREIGGQRAIFLRFAWLSGLGPIEQSLTMILRPGKTGNLVVTFATTTPSARVASLRPIFARILASINFDEPRSLPSHARALERAPQLPIIPIPGVPTVRDPRRGTRSM